MDRFKLAQDSRFNGYETALAELQVGQKSSHWIWYVFPQLAGLGHSAPAQMYALRDLNEAIEFLQDPVLGVRLVRLTDVVEEQIVGGTRLPDLMGGEIDALKLASSLTLFELAAQKSSSALPLSDHARFAQVCANVLAAAAREGFPRCRYTLEHARPSESLGG